MFTKVAITAALAGLAAAAPAPISKRQDINDALILNYALTLEHLESAFYRQGLANYSAEQFAAAGYSDLYYRHLKVTSSDEDTHVNFLTSALKAAGAPAVAECTYNFPSTDPKSFVVLSSVLEGVGVSAYLGAAHRIANPDYLTAAGSILTVEARHSTWMRSWSKRDPFAQAFDVPLYFDSVYSLAAPFIASCPSTNPPLPFKAFPALAVGTPGNVTQGSTVLLNTPGYDLVPPQGGQMYGVWISALGPTIVDATKVEGGYNVPVPQGFAGQSYVVLSACKDEVNDETVAAGPAIVEIADAVGY